MNAREIIDMNEDVIMGFFVGMASNEYWDGRCYRLMMNTETMEIFEDFQPSANSWIEGDGLVILETICGYSDTPEDETYQDGCSLADFGYDEWLDNLAEKIELAIEAA